MNTKWKVAAVALLLTVGLGCPQPMQEATSGPDVDAINEVRAAEFAAMAAGDIEAAVAVFTDDCVLMPPNGAAVVGHEALGAWVQAFTEMGAIGGEYTGSDVVVLGDWAIERYTATMTVTPPGGETAEETIKGIHTYRRQADGSWKIAQDVWNSDIPLY